MVKNIVILFLALALTSGALMAQGVTTAAMNGKVTDNAGNALPGVNVIATHQPSGTKYGVTTREDGQYNLPNLRAGGPYIVSVSLIGYSKQEYKNIDLQLSQTLRQNFRLTQQDVQIGAVEVTAERSTVLNAARTGAATAVSRNAIEALPTITRKVQDFSRLTPQFQGNNTFGGMDNRYNNTTIDGSYFNNSFGLQGQPGDRTNVAPISIDAIEQVQVNVAPYDVRQGNFVGAAVNTITKSGTNDISGSVYYLYRHQGLVGQKAGDVEYKPGTFKYNQIGLRLGGPIIQNQLFLFASFESDALVQPGTSFVANTDGLQPVGGNTTRVNQSDLDNLSSFLSSKFGYATGPYQGYNNEVPALRFMSKLDYNLDDKNKLTLRYIHLNSKTDVLVSNSSSLGIGGNRQNSTNGLAYQNSNYQIGEYIRNVIGEWNGILSDKMSNNLIVGYSHHDESRDSRGSFFPFVDILKTGTNYISFGFEPFTPNNELRYSSLQLQDNLSYSLGEHYLTLGASVERYQSENIFFPGAQSAYVYNTLSDFMYDANRAPTDTAASLRRFQVRWSNIPGQIKPIQDLKVTYVGVYAQDEYQLTKDIRITGGLRIDVPYFQNTALDNSEVRSMVFRDETGNPVTYATNRLPKANILWSPRAGFNWDITGERTTQLRGGTGIFTGKPAYVWISNQIGNNGILTGFQQLDGTASAPLKDHPFNPDPNYYKPTTVSGAPAASYELALTDPNFKFPQLWRSNIAVDQKLPYDVVGTAEFLYGKDVNGIYYINADLPAADTVFVGVDNRPRWKTTNKIISKIPDAIVMKNQNVGYSWNAAFSLEKTFSEGWFAKAAYSYGVSKNTVDPGSIASGSWYGNAQSGDPNNPGVGFAATSPRHRVFGTVSYRAQYFDMGATTVSVFVEGRTLGYVGGIAVTNASYVYAGDLNGDGGTANDLIYIPKDQSEMNFKAIAATSTAPAFTVQQQMDAWDAYINQDDYLKANRGKYAERNAVFMPMVFRADLSLVQEVYTEFLGKRNSLQIRADVLNVTNLLNKNWGVGQRMVTTQPLIPQATAADGKVLYQLARVNNALIDHTFEKTAGIDDVFKIQLGIRYTFN